MVINLSADKKFPEKVEIYDTTLRDGAQSERISFSVKDKIRIARKIDELGISYIEGGWPGSNGTDTGFFSNLKEPQNKLKNSELVAFGSTKHAGNPAGKDRNLKALLNSGADVICIFGKSWDLHVKDALKVSLEENLSLIRDSINFLRSKGKKVIFDAEHFFDGYKKNKEYALETIKIAEGAGAGCIVLCDTNGGLLPHEVEGIFNEVRKTVKTPLGIHAHNDSENAVANSIMAVKAGAIHAQGTINGYGERCGNTNLCSLIPNLKLKLGIDCIPDESLRKLVEVSRFVNEMANLPPHDKEPYVGKSAFTHKGGIHIDAVLKNPVTYEHIDPEKVGNERRLLVSNQAGRSTLIHKAEKAGLRLDKKSPELSGLLDEFKRLEAQGYQFEGAEASFELLVKKAMKQHTPFFDLQWFDVSVSQKNGGTIARAIVKISVRGETKVAAGEGNGPVNALDSALRKALESFYPVLRDVRLTDYKVRVLDAEEGTAAKVRVLIASGDKKRTWGTVGVSANIIKASWIALVDSYEYKLFRENK